MLQSKAITSKEWRLTFAWVRVQLSKSHVLEFRVSQAVLENTTARTLYTWTVDQFGLGSAKNLDIAITRQTRRKAGFVFIATGAFGAKTDLEWTPKVMRQSL